MNIFRKTLSSLNIPRRRIIQKHVRQFSSIYEPDYLDAMKPKHPLYDTLNIQIRGYDYPVVESFQKCVHAVAKNMDIDVEDCWGVPAQDLKLTTFKPNSEIPNSQFNLKMYERNVQITDISSIQMSVLLRVLEKCTPAGIFINIVEHEEYHEENRYIPDSELNTLKQTLDEMGGPLKKK